MPRDSQPRAETIFRDLYFSEINFSLSCFYDGGFDVKLGDSMNGFKAEDNFDKLDQAAEWLHRKACEFYPNSYFAVLHPLSTELPFETSDKPGEKL